MTRARTAPGWRRRPNEHRLMAALGVVALSVTVLTYGGLFGKVSDAPADAAELPLLQLQLSGADVGHFERIYAHLDPPRNTQRYQEENSWRRAQLVYDGRSYDVKVKSHGQEPTDHSETSDDGRYRFISLSIKLAAGERIHGLNRFKLIVPRAFPHAAPTMNMGKHAGAFVQDHRPVRVRINNWPAHRFYFSNALDERYLETIGFSPFHGDSDHLLIYSNYWRYRQSDAAAIRRRFELAQVQMETPESEWDPLFERYAAFNAALSGSSGTDTDPTEFLDPAYMQRYETVRYVLGFSGHGYLPANLRMFLNTANGKFYPGFSRDHELTALDLRGERTPEFQINAYTDELGDEPRPLPLFHYVATSDRLRQRVYREIYKIIEGLEAADGALAGGARGGPDCNDLPFVGGLPFVGEARQPGGALCDGAYTRPPDIVHETVASNIESLRTWLETSAPEFSARVTPQRLHLTIRPNSMSALRVDMLTIGAEHGHGPVRVDVTDVHGPRERPVVESYPVALRADGTVELSSALVDARLFTGMDLTQSAPPLPKAEIRWIDGLEEAHRLRLERRLGLQNGTPRSTRGWRYELADTSPERLADIVGNDAVEDTQGINREDYTLPDQDQYRPRRLTRAPRRYELVLSFSRPLPGLDVESVAVSFVNTVTGQTVAARRFPAVEAPAADDLHPASAFSGVNDRFEDWAAAHDALPFLRTGPREITLARGVHDLTDDLLFPSGYDVVIEDGTALRLGPGVVMLVRGGLTVAGSVEHPVTIRPIDGGQPFGAVAVLGDGSQRTTIRHLDLSGGSDAWVRGARFSGALSIHYQRDLQVSHSAIHGNHGDAGLSITYASGLLADSAVSGNRAAQIDLNYFDGVVRGNRVAGSDALRTDRGMDLIGSRLVATNNEVSGFEDTGVRVAESSAVLLAANTWRDNGLALAVTDLSTVYVHADNAFNTNELDVRAFLQKDHFGGGTVVLAGATDSAGRSIETDRLSSVVHVARTVIEQLRPSEITPTGVVPALAGLSGVPRSPW